jgi:glycosyltransferase involved in cell wall biosynthesis
MSDVPFVSVLTPTFNRRKFIPILIRCFKAQTYPMDRMEWIVVDDGSDKVKDLFDAAKIPNLRYIPLDNKITLGAKRNMLNDVAKGDICVAMDDDDFYPPDRVKISVTRLRSVKDAQIKVAGSSQMYIYFADRDEIWSAGPYGPDHCTNGTMSYWRSYTLTHRYDDTASKAEEKFFLEDYKAKVLQMDSAEHILVISHSKNTFDKRILLEQKNPLLTKTSMKLKAFVKDKIIRDFYMTLKEDAVAEPIIMPTDPRFAKNNVDIAELNLPTLSPEEKAPPPVIPVKTAKKTRKDEKKMEELKKKAATQKGTKLADEIKKAEERKIAEEKRAAEEEKAAQEKQKFDKMMAEKKAQEEKEKEKAAQEKQKSDKMMAEKAQEEKEKPDEIVIRV